MNTLTNLIYKQILSKVVAKESKKIIAHLRYLSVMRRRSELAHEVSNRRQFIFVAFLFYTGFDRNLLNQNINNN